MIKELVNWHSIGQPDGLDRILWRTKTPEPCSKRFVTCHYPIHLLSFNKTINDFSFLISKQYSAEEMGGHGGGGEYEIQLGFGWSNGVVMQFLADYGEQMKSSGSENEEKCDKLPESQPRISPNANSF